MTGSVPVNPGYRGGASTFRRATTLLERRQVEASGFRPAPGRDLHPGAPSVGCRGVDESAWDSWTAFAQLPPVVALVARCRRARAVSGRHRSHGVKPSSLASRTGSRSARAWSGQGQRVRW